MSEHNASSAFLQKVQEISPDLHCLDIERVLDTAYQALLQLGFEHISIYRRVRKQWTNDETLLIDRRANESDLLHLERPSEASANTPREIDTRDFFTYSNPLIDIQPDSQRADQTRIAIPLRCVQERLQRGLDRDDPQDNNLIGLLVLDRVPQHLQHLSSYIIVLAQQMALALRNAQNYDEIKDYQTALAEPVWTIFDHQVVDDPDKIDDDKVYDKFATAAATVLHFKRAVISLIDKVRDVVIVRGLHGLVPEEESKIRAEREIPRAAFEQLLKPEWQQGSSFFIPERDDFDYQRWGGFILQPERYATKPWNWHAFDILRTQVKNTRGEVIGYISMDEQLDGRRPDDNTLKALEVFSSQFGVMFENITYRRTLAAIKRIGDRISSVRGIDELLDDFRTEVNRFRLMNVDVMTVGRYHRTNSQQIIEVIYSKQMSLQEHGLEERWNDARGLTGYIVRSNQTLRFESRAEIEAFQQQHAITPLGHQAHSWLGAPLRVNDEVIGVIVLQDYTRSGVYEDHHQRLLEILADQIAIAMQRIEMEALWRLIQESVITWLSDSNVNMRHTEQQILESACRLTGADYGMLLGYDNDDKSLIYSEGYIARSGLHTLPTFSSGLRLPLEPKLGDQRSLSIQVAKRNGRKPKRWDDVEQVSDDYYKVLDADIRSQISIPLLVEDRLGDEPRILSVLTLESTQVAAFSERHEQDLVTLCKYAALAYKRAQEQQRYRSLLVWNLDHVSSNLVRHRYISSGQVLEQRLKNTVQDIGVQIEQLQSLHEAAKHIRPAAGIYLDRCYLVSINDIVRDFLRTHRVLYTIPGVELCEFSDYAPDTTEVFATALGLRETLKILVDHGFEMLREADGGKIEISTDTGEHGVLLRVHHTGRRPDRRSIALLEEPERGFDTTHEFGNLALLLTLYNAACTVFPNSDEDELFGVTFTITFPYAQERSDTWQLSHPSAAESTKALDRLQRKIASHSALLFAQVVTDQAPRAQRQFDNLLHQLDDIKSQLVVFTRNIDAKLDQVDPEPISVKALLREFIEEDSRPISDKDTIIPIVCHLDDKDDTCVWGNRLGIRYVLDNLVSNARREIRKVLREGQSAPSIRIMIGESTGAWIRIHVHNQGTLIPVRVASQLFDGPTSDTEEWPEFGDENGKGMGLFMCKELLARYNGSIHLTFNSEQAGVRFTIELPRAVESRRQGEDNELPV